MNCITQKTAMSVFVLSMICFSTSAQWTGRGQDDVSDTIKLFRFNQERLRERPAFANQAFRLRDKAPGRAELAAEIFSCKLVPVMLEDGQTYASVRIDGATVPAEVGEPNLPMVETLVRVPEGAEVRLDIGTVEYEEADTSLAIAPRQEPEPDTINPKTGRQPDVSFRKNHMAYMRRGYRGGPPVELAGKVRVRGREFVTVRYRPVEYDPRGKKLRFAKYVEWSLAYDPAKTEMRPRSSDDERIGTWLGLRAIDIRPESDTEGETDAVGEDTAAVESELISDPEQADYLIIAADSFYSGIQSLANWKHRKGYKTVRVKMSDVGTTQADVYNCIKNAYDNGSLLKYVLLVGDVEHIPLRTLDDTQNTDIGYTYVDGDDMYSDITIGRLAVDNTTQLSTIVNKILNYEKNPFSGDWYKNILLSGQFEDNDSWANMADRWFMENLHRLGDFLGSDYDFFNSNPDPYNKGYTLFTAFKWDRGTTSELKYLDTEYGFPGRLMQIPGQIVPDSWKAFGGGTKTEIAEAINNGVGIALHRDHGYGDGSGWGYPGFRTADVNALSNGDQLPVVFSFNCSSGRYDDKDAFAEAWIRKSGGGAVGHMGALGTSYSGYNDCLFVGIMDCAWSDFNSSWNSSLYSNSRRPAEMMAYGRHFLINGYSASDSYTKLTCALFNWLGDPEMAMRTKSPSSLTVTHPSSLTVGQSSSFTVNVKAGGANLNKARVALVKDGDIYQVRITGSNGNASFTVTPQSAGTLMLTVSEENARPYLANITIEESGDTPPNVYFTSPANGATVDPDFSVSVNANDENGINRVIFYIDGQWQGADTTAPYTWDFSGVADGEHEIRALARDNNGNTANAYRTVMVGSGSSGGEETFNNLNQSSFGNGSFPGDAGFTWNYTKCAHQDGGITGRSLKMQYGPSCSLTGTIPAGISQLSFKMKNAVSNGGAADYGFNVYVNGVKLPGSPYKINAMGSVKTVTIDLTPSGSSTEVKFENYKRYMMLDDISWEEGVAPPPPEDGETFNNLNQSSFGNGSFTGDAGFNWSYTKCAHQDGGISGRSIKMQYGPDCTLTGTIPAGISQLSFKMKNAVSNGGAADYGFNVYVNGVKLPDSPYKINAMGAVKTVTIDLTPSGNSTEIKFENYKRYMMLDDVGWE